MWAHVQVEEQDVQLEVLEDELQAFHRISEANDEEENAVEERPGAHVSLRGEDDQSWVSSWKARSGGGVVDGSERGVDASRCARETAVLSISNKKYIEGR